MPKGDRIRLASVAGGHRLEWRVLSGLFPIVLWVACFDLLSAVMAAPWAAVVALPSAFLVVHAMTFSLPLRRPASQFLGWSALLSIWAWYALDADATLVRWVAYVWWGFVAIQLLGVVGLFWQTCMTISGRAGMVVRAILALVVHLVMVACWWRFGWPAGVACSVLICGVWAMCVFRPTSRIFGPVSCRVRGDCALLTIDDGPHPVDTPRILDLLDEHGVKAVFFVVGDKVREYSEWAREIVKRGHELGNHTMTHPQGLMWILGPWRTWKEIPECQKVIKEVAGVEPRWFRAPVGHRNYFTHPVTSALGLEVIAWTHRAFDTVETDVARVADRLTNKVGSGDVLLMHEDTAIAGDLAERVLQQCPPLSVSSTQSSDC